MKKIPLTRGKYALVDDEDYGWLIKFKWSASWSGNRFYAKRGGSKSYMHRDIAIFNNILTNEKLFIDHKDGNGFNNQKSNLRMCTPGENTRNSKGKRVSTSKYKGVSFDFSVGRRKRWRSQIRIDGLNIFIGIFQFEDDAARAYNEKALALYGEFAYLNEVT